MLVAALRWTNIPSWGEESTPGCLPETGKASVIWTTWPVIVYLYESINQSVNQFMGWRSVESARLPPMCPGFDSRTQRHMWVEFVVCFLLCPERFFSGYSGFQVFLRLLSSKTNISKFSPMNEKFSIRSKAECSIENFEFIVQ